MATTSTVIAAMRKAIKGRKTESGERNAAQSVLASYGHFGLPTITAGRDPGGATVRVYLWDTPWGELYLQSGPSIEGEIHEATEAAYESAPVGAYVATAPLTKAKAAKVLPKAAKVLPKATGGTRAPRAPRPPRTPPPVAPPRRPSAAFAAADRAPDDWFTTRPSAVFAATERADDTDWWLDPDPEGGAALVEEIETAETVDDAVDAIEVADLDALKSAYRAVKGGRGRFPSEAKMRAFLAAVAEEAEEAEEGDVIEEIEEIEEIPAGSIEDEWAEDIEDEPYAPPAPGMTRIMTGPRAGEDLPVPGYKPIETPPDTPDNAAMMAQFEAMLARVMKDLQ